MNLPRFALTHRPIVLVFVAVFLAAGSFNFATMSRREDPEITIRDALVITPWPGAPATRVEELITDPIEDVIVEIAEIDTVESKSMVGLSIIQATAGDDIKDVDQVWDDVRTKVESVQGVMPLGSAPSFVNSDFGDVYEIVFAIHQAPPAEQSTSEGPYSPRQLEIFAERIEEEIELLESVRRVELWGVQPERIYVEVDSADWAKLAVTAGQLRQLFQARNIVFPGGELDTEQNRYAVNPTGEFTSVKQMSDLIVERVDGTLPVKLGDLPVRIERRYQEPSPALTRLTQPEAPHQSCLVIGISMKSGRNVSEMNAEVVAALARLRTSFLPPDVELTRVNDLPRQVSTRIEDFQTNLLQGVGIVLAVALLAMGWRPAVIMASAVPLSMIAAFAVVRYLGIEMEQFSIASLIIALGMVVDNAIVVSDNAYRLMREGVARFEAVIQGAQDLSIPILTSTLTTIAAFLPMLTMEGDVGEYVSSLPVVVAATLGASYFVAMLVTPIMCAWLLKPKSPGKAETGGPKFLARYDDLIAWCLKHPILVLTAASGLFVSSLTLLPIIGTQFFPSGSRDQFFVKVWLPEGSAIAATSRVARKVEQALVEASPLETDGGAVERLQNVVTFIGTGGPRLMITQEPEYDYPYFALLLVNTTDASYTNQYALEIRKRLADFVEARVTVDLFTLGPPVKDPVAFRLSGPKRDVIEREARGMVRRFKEEAGTKDPYSNWGAPSYQVEIAIDSDAANLAGVTNADVAFTTSTLLSGALLTTYREGDHRVPVMLRTIREKREDLSDLSDIYVNGQFGKVPLNSIAKVIPSWQPAVIARRNGVPTVTVGSRVDDGELANTVASRLKPRLEEMLSTLPPDYFLRDGGDLEETTDAQRKVVLAVAISIVLMILVLTVQYNSVIKPAVILFAVPMAMIGVLVGLFATGWPMGFMAMLGILALGGIVINNAIVLVDFIETKVAEGVDLRTAVASAGRLRMRPIILTTLTTIGGLLPLSLFGGALWAPMTNGMIFGLMFSTALTLIVVPTIYVLFAERLGMRVVDQ